MKKISFDRHDIFIATSLLIVLLDQFSKYWIQKILPLNGAIKLASFFSITHTINYGAGFSILQGWRIFLILFTFFAIAVVFYYYKQIPNNLVSFYAALILGGAVGNLLDRILFSYVVDFITFSFWPSFNVADSAITLGAIGLVIYYWND